MLNGVHLPCQRFYSTAKQQPEDGGWRVFHGTVDSV